MNRALTFFGQIFQPFLKTSSLRAPPRKSCVAYACAPKRLLTLYNSVGRATATQPTLAACWFFHHPIHNKSNETASDFFWFKPLFRSRSPLLTGSRLIFLPLATQMFQFAKFEKSKERRLATELGYGFPIGDPWITDALSPHGLSPLQASFLLNARASIQCMIFDSFFICGRLNTHPISISHRKTFHLYSWLERLSFDTKSSLFQDRREAFFWYEKKVCAKLTSQLWYHERPEKGGLSRIFLRWKKNKPVM